MTNDLITTTVDVAHMVARGEHGAEQLLAERMTELLAADAGVRVTRWVAQAGGAPELTVAVSGLPPATPAWLDLATNVGPRTPSMAALARVGVRRPVRVSDALDLRRLWGTEEFEFLHGASGGRYPMGVAFLRRPDQFVFMGLNRSKRDFDDDDLVNLRHLQRVLTHAYAFRRALDDAVREVTQPVAHRRRTLSWLTALTSEYEPTRREAEVLALLAEGWTNQQIASRLGISERTVRKHLGAVYEQAGVSGRVAAAAWWRSRS